MIIGTQLSKDEMRQHSVGIACEMKEGQIAELTADNGEFGDNRLEIWEIGGFRVANTNGDPIWQEAEPESFAAALAACERGNGQ